MNYEKRNLVDSDSRLVKFTDVDVNEDVGRYDNVVYVRFKYDLSEDQVDSIKDEAETVEYDFDTFDDWVEAVVKKAMGHECWKHDKDNDWEFWAPYPCLEIEV